MDLSPKRWFAFLLLLTLCPILGCAALKEQWDRMTSFSKCQFRMVSVEKTTVAGIRVQGLTRVSDIPFMELAKLQSLFSTGTLPLQFTLNLEAKNPNASPAGMNKFAWILSMDGNEMTSGLMEKAVEIPAGGTGAVPLGVSLDLRKTLSGKTLDSMLNLALNVAGEGSKPTHLSIKLKPSIMIQGQELEYPDYITVSREFTSAKND